MKSLLILLVLLCLSSLATFAQAEKSGGSNCSQLLEGLEIPADIAVPAGNKLKEVYYAEGLQHYVFNGSAWVVFNATAPLYMIEKSTHKSGGRKLLTQQAAKKEAVGQHFFLGNPDASGGQPSWETALPVYSLVTGLSLRAVTVDPNSITWNLLQATSHSGSLHVLGAVTYIQRVDSKGGLPPSTSLGAQLGDIHVTPYSIIYAFYVKAD